MYCRFCGAEISEQSRFCSSCGKPQDSEIKPAANHWPTVLRYIIGTLLILGGVLPYLLQGDLVEYNSYTSAIISRDYGLIGTTAVSALRRFASVLSPLFYFSSSVLAVYAGILLLKKEARLKGPVAVCGIAHIASIIYSGVVNLLIYRAPQFVLSIYTTDELCLAVGEKIISSSPEVLYYYQENALCRLNISLLLIALAAVFLVVEKRYMNKRIDANTKVSHIGNILMILSVSVLSVGSKYFSTIFTGLYSGTEALSANAVADSAFNIHIRSAVLFAFIIILAVAVACTKARRRILTISITSVVMIFGLAVLLFSDMLIQDMKPPVELFALASASFKGLIVGSVVILIAMFFWFSSVSRNKIPTWLQIALPLLLPVICFGTAVVNIAYLRQYYGVSWSCSLLGAGIITVMASLLSRSGNSKYADNV